MSRSRQESVVLALMAVVPTYLFSVLDTSFCLGTFLVGCRSSAFLQGHAGFNIFKITYFNDLQKQNWLIETNDKRWEVETVEATNLMQTSAQFCEVFSSFFCRQGCFATFVGRASAIITCVALLWRLFYSCCFINLIVDRASWHYLHTRTRLRFWLPKAVISKSVILRTKIQYNKSKVIVL